ncbi:MFS transporter [Pyxidicoccus fallax]|uniref:MFS transporter n=1 Tax=Pyxidicoccus fallax TaxID=394095 RepID=A0A848L9Y8_9BACT|nr:MFS transporter [Pyxidicoccus fallax]NMO13493.1 MFS transporter [Pyxidicoccus fallax]NPC76707.1 MFS transporter [Pyxidicoccus fallax]
MRTFFTVWFGQLISTLGSGLTNFALGAYVYETSGSVTNFALVMFFGSLPLVILSPLAGVLADRWDRRKIILWGDIGSAVSILLIWLLLVGHDSGYWTIKAWYFYLPLFLGSACSALCFPAWIATVPLIVPRQHLGRASGMTELSSALAQIFGPILSSSLMGPIGLRGILVLDAISYLFAVGVLLFVRFPQPSRDAEKSDAPRSLKEDLREAWNFIRERPGLRRLMLFVTSIGFVVYMVMLLINPLVLAFGDVQDLGRIATTAGVGGLLGGILTSVWGGPKRRVLGLMGFSAVASLVLLLAALPPSVPLIAGAAAVFLFTFPLISSSNQVLWQTKTPPSLQGRVASLRRVLFQGTGLTVTLMGGILADQIFEPAMMPGGVLASTLGQVIGVGKGRGIAVMFIALSGLLLANVVMLAFSPRVRNLETELPDVLPAQPGPEAGPLTSTDNATARAETAPRLAPTGSTES